MRYPILIHLNDRLKGIAQPIDIITGEIITLLDDLYETIIANDGTGITTPQVGQSERIVMIEVDEGKKFGLINPEIIETKGESLDIRGCLSISYVYETVKQADEVTVHYYDRDGEEIGATAFDYLARVFQYEIDRLDGILFIEKMIQQIPEEELEKYTEGHFDD